MQLKLILWGNTEFYSDKPFLLQVVIPSNNNLL